VIRVAVTDGVEYPREVDAGAAAGKEKIIVEFVLA
jgi:hypothetical protein